MDDEAEQAEAEREVEVLVEQASQVAKSRGLMPGSAQSLIDEYKKAKVDWRAVLRQLMQSQDHRGLHIHSSTQEALSSDEHLRLVHA